MKLILQEIKKILNYRDLIWNLSINKIKEKYRYPILGFLWIILMPILLALIFLFAFSVVIKVRVPHYPFFIYLFCAMLPWSYLSTSIMQSTNSLVESTNLVKNVSFCREIIPISSILSNLINFIFTLPVLFLFLFIFKIKVSIYIIFLPFVILLQTIFIIGVSLLTSACQVRLRDTKYIVELLITAFFYLAPVFYPLDLVKNISPLSLRIYMLNPNAAIITLYRIVILGGYTAFLPPEVNLFNLVIIPVILSLFVLHLGFLIFKKFETSFADLI